MTVDEHELGLRRSTYQWISALYREDVVAVEHDVERMAVRRAQIPAALGLVEQLCLSSDAVSFRDALNALTSPKDSALGLSGPNGQMMLNQIVTYSEDPTRAGEILGRAFVPPTSDDDARAKIEEVITYCGEIKRGSHPHAGRVGPLLSVFWSYRHPGQWPALWSSAGTAIERLGWHLPKDHGSYYVEFASLMRALGDPEDVWPALQWYSKASWPGPDPTMRQRTVLAWQMRADGLDGTEAAFANVAAMLEPLRSAGDDLREPIGAALDRNVTKHLAPRKRAKDTARYDSYVYWSPDVVDEGWTQAPGLRIWFGTEGVAVGLHPGYRGQGWSSRANAKLRDLLPDGLEMVPRSRLLPEKGEAHDDSQMVIGRFHQYDEYDWSSGRDEIVSIAGKVLPVLQALLLDGPSWDATSTGSRPVVEPAAGDALLDLYDEFVRTHPYPGQGDLEQQAAREVLAAPLAQDVLDRIDVREFRRIQNTPKYGFAGNRMSLNRTLAADDEEAMQAHVVEVVADLLYGSDDEAARIDRATDRLSGLGQAGAAKLLALVHPQRWVPIYPLTGSSGKLALLPVVGVSEVPQGSPSERSVVSNDLIRQRLSTIPALADDPWGQVVFAYWLRDRSIADVEEETDTLDTRLAEATEACTLPPDSTFLQELVALLEDKGQIVLYGPPGTGKTYLALELAKAIAPDEEQRSLVQFHPSMSYEDFMEGFRPVLRGNNLTYELAEGPLLELANRAELDGRPHVLIIDEMNRANLPKVFGELLFLLEYRDRPMKLAYRSVGDEFALPKNLWIIGTMNLADRSVGQIDAALRRRFAFVPFTPSDEQNGGLLRRWLAKKNLDTWPADLVDLVNEELEKDLGHTDLLIGPSYFMKAELDEARMALIWRYAIEPLAADLFHGDDRTVRKYSWAEVTKRHQTVLPSSAPIIDVDVDPGEVVQLVDSVPDEGGETGGTD